MTTDGEIKWLSAGKLAKLADCHRGTVNNFRVKRRIPPDMIRAHAGLKPRYDYQVAAVRYLKREAIYQPPTDN